MEITRRKIAKEEEEEIYILLEATRIDATEDVINELYDRPFEEATRSDGGDELRCEDALLNRATIREEEPITIRIPLMLILLLDRDLLDI